MTTTTTTILRIVCDAYDVPLDALRGPGRPHVLTRPRMVAMVLLRRYAGLTLTEIAGALCRRDHTTVLSALAQADALMADADAQRCEAETRAALADQRLLRQREAIRQPLDATWPGLCAPLSRIARKAA